MSVVATTSALLAVLGSALVAGVFFAFSSFIMKALARLPTHESIAAMQSINVVVLNRSFLGLFIGTTVISVLVAVLAIKTWGSPSAPYFLTGATLYVVGTFLVTGLGNVPLNDRLAAVTATDLPSAAVWDHYLGRWTLLNTSRTAAAAAAALMFALGLISPDAAGAVRPVQDGKSIVAEARAIVDSYHELGWFSGSVLLARGGKPIYQAAVGLADRESATPNSLGTKYNLGSIIKNFTAVLVLQQVDRGVIGLDDDLYSFDLGFPADTAQRITVRHLLSHQSGFPGAFPSEYRENQLAFRTVADKLALLRDAPLLFEPGTERLYSNYGYVVLGAILQEATGESFASLLHKNIFEPLKLEDSVYPYRKGVASQSLRYTFNYAREQVFVGATEHHGPDGGIESTVADVLAFYRALFYGDALLSRDGSATSEYFPMDGDYWASFGGGTGVSAAVELDLQNDYQIIVLANTDGLVAEEISGRIYSYIQAGAYDPIALPPVVFAWEKYLELGPEAFTSEFLVSYESAGYSRFVGRTLNDLGMSLVNDAKWNDAFNVFGTLVESFPEVPQVYDSLAYAHFRVGDLSQARRTFSMALRLQPAFASDYSSNNYGHRANR